MKKHIALLLTVLMTTSAIPSNVFGAEKDVLLSHRVSLKQDTELTTTNAPLLTIQSNSVYTKDFRFEVILNGAEWTGPIDDGTFSFGNGITYVKIGNDRLRVSVDAKTYKPNENDITIPLLTKLTRKGEIAVSIEPGTSSLEPSQFVFANTGGSQFSIESDMVPKLEMVGSLGAITIKDDFLSQVNENTIYPLTLDNNFIFYESPTIETYGKYKDLVQFSIDSKDSSKAYLTITKKTDVGFGKIVLSGLQIRPQKNSAFAPVNLTLKRGNETLKVEVAKYVSSTKTSIPITIDELVAEKSPKASGTAARDRLLQIRIDDKEYGNVTSKEDGTWSYSLPSKRKRLQAGTHTFAVGYYSEQTEKWIEVVKKDFFIPIKVEFTIGQNSYLYDDNSIFTGIAPYVDQNNRTMMPLRVFSTVLGVDENGIIWNETDKTVTIKKDSKTLVVKIGSNELLINNVPQKMDTVAVIERNRTFLPLRAVMNGFSLSDDAIHWDNDAQKITLLLNH